MDDYRAGDRSTEARLLELDARLAEIAETEPYREPVGWLRCFRGIDTLTAMLILAELHDFRRFASHRALMAYLGLVPGEDSSGEKHRRGRITRTGNALVRRLLVEVAWHYQHRPSVGVALATSAHRTTVACHCDRGQGAAAVVSTLPAAWPPHTNRRRRSRSRSRASWRASCGRRCNPHRHRRSDGRRRQGRGMAATMTRPGDGPRRRRMIRGTNVRIGDKAMRYGPASQLAPLDCTSSRRSTVMCALPRATAVTTVYQRDSSSKRPRSSVVSAARAPDPRPRNHVANTASRASRPAGGACGAPGHRVRHVREAYACALTPAGTAKPPSIDRGLTRGHSISARHPSKCAASTSTTLSDRRIAARICGDLI